MKTPLELARAFVALIDGLNSVPGMMTTHDTGKEAIARRLIELEAKLSAPPAAVRQEPAELLLAKLRASMASDLATTEKWFADHYAVKSATIMDPQGLWGVYRKVYENDIAKLRVYLAALDEALATPPPNEAPSPSVAGGGLRETLEKIRDLVRAHSNVVIANTQTPEGRELGTYLSGKYDGLNHAWRLLDDEMKALDREASAPAAEATRHARTENDRKIIDELKAELAAKSAARSPLEKRSAVVAETWLEHHMPGRYSLDHFVQLTQCLVRFVEEQKMQPQPTTSAQATEKR